MRKGFWGVALVLGTVSLGCSGSPTVAKPEERIGPHQGTLIKLPNDQGYAEVVDASQTKGRPARGAPTQIVAYFLDSELKGPSTVAPSGVIVKLSIVTGKPAESITLEPAAEAGDPLGKKRFASKAGPYQLAGVHGELSATIDGQPFNAEFDALR